MSWNDLRSAWAAASPADRAHLVPHFLRFARCW